MLSAWQMLEINPPNTSAISKTKPQQWHSRLLINTPTSHTDKSAFVDFLEYLIVYNHEFNTKEKFLPCQASFLIFNKI
ncbi:hypothetical protein B0181_09570 [Moraxella caviae]|uniref:Uncharacterized protein n=2 Tax=Moraxella caviae TaxID=34060 RepID=A0A1S9ZWG8_9GAMM|nr:hypothetical protein B0181_09570 [Moraxella caviae]STZ10551.1 Uncharacterised protein [Moraxella caviae]